MRPWFQFSLSHQTSCKSETCWWWTSMIMVFVQKHVWLILYSWLLNILNILNILSLSSKYTYIQKLGCHGDLTNNQAREAQLLILWAVELTHAMIGTSVNQKLCSVAISFRPPPPLNQQPWFSTAGSADLPPYIQKAKNFADSDDHVDSSECVWLSLWLWHCIKKKDDGLPDDIPEGEQWLCARSRCWAVAATRITAPWGHTAHCTSLYFCIFTFLYCCSFSGGAFHFCIRSELIIDYDCTVWENKDFLSFGCLRLIRSIYYIAIYTIYVAIYTI